MFGIEEFEKKESFDLNYGVMQRSLSRKDQQNKSALQRRAESIEPQWNSLQIPRGKHSA